MENAFGPVEIAADVLAFVRVVAGEQAVLKILATGEQKKVALSQLAQAVSAA